MAPDVCSDSTPGRGQVAKNPILMGHQIISYAHTAHVNWQYVAGITADVSLKTLTRQYASNITLRSVRVTIFVKEKQKVLHNLRVCVCCLSYAACKAHAPYYIVICECPALQYFFTLSHKGHNFRKEIIEHKMRALIFSTNFVWKFYHSKKKSARYYHKCTYIGLHVKYPLFLADFDESWISWTQFRKILKYQNA
jgi:hypothetical protein